MKYPHLMPAVGLLAMLTSAAVTAVPASTTKEIKPPPLPATTAEALVATGRWVVSGENNRCMATRGYGSASAPITLAIRPYPMGSVARLTIVEPKLGRSGAFETGGVRFGSAATPVGVYVGLVSGTNGMRIAESSIERADLEQSVASKELWLYSKSFNRRLRVEGLKNVLGVLATCERQLIADNGMSLAEQARMKTGAIIAANVGSYARTGDYPMNALRGDQQGSAMVRLVVGADGKPGECRTVETSGWPALDQATCAVGKRMRFSPARDQGGKPMQALYFYTLRWVLPG